MKKVEDIQYVIEIRPHDDLNWNRLEHAPASVTSRKQAVVYLRDFAVTWGTMYDEVRIVETCVLSSKVLSNRRERP